mgnify:CR=1 FL=1
MGKTVQVAADRAFDQTKTILPAELARGVYMRNAPSLRALKLMHLMIGTAGGRMADDVRHEIRLSDIRKIEGMAHHDKESLKPLFEELRAAVLTYDDPEAMRYTIGGLLDQAVVDYRHEVSGDVLVSWYFGRMFRDMAAKSNHWAILDRQTVFHLGSKYSVLLFQHIASFSLYKHIKSRTFTVSELRALLGVPEGKIRRFANLKKDALEPAIAEINQISRLILTATPNKIGRTVASVTITWVEKDAEGKAATKRELDQPRVGRKARRDGSAETVESVIEFPSGSIRYTPFQAIATANLPEPMRDLDRVAEDFRAAATREGKPLRGSHVTEMFAAFCRSQKPAI